MNHDSFLCMFLFLAEVLRRLRRVAPVYAVRGNVDPAPTRATPPSEGQEPVLDVRIDSCRWLPQETSHMEGPTGDTAQHTGKGRRREMGGPERRAAPEPCVRNGSGMAMHGGQQVKRQRLGEKGGKEALGAGVDSGGEREGAQQECRHQEQEQAQAQKESQQQQEQQQEEEEVAAAAEEEDLLRDHLLVEVAGWRILVTHIVGKPPAGARAYGEELCLLTC